MSDDDFLLVCDAQTSGGLLVALPQDQARGFRGPLPRRGAPAGAVIGRVIEKGSALLRVTP